MITHAGCWENMRKACKSRAKGEWFTSFLSVLPTSQVGYQAGKPIESVVYCFYKITLGKMENVSVFPEFTGTINHRFLTNQNACTILVILKNALYNYHLKRHVLIGFLHRKQSWMETFPDVPAQDARWVIGLSIKKRDSSLTVTVSIKK